PARFGATRTTIRKAAVASSHRFATKCLTAATSSGPSPAPLPRPATGSAFPGGLREGLVATGGAGEWGSAALIGSFLTTGPYSLCRGYRLRRTSPAGPTPGSGERQPVLELGIKGYEVFCVTLPSSYRACVNRPAHLVGARR